MATNSSRGNPIAAADGPPISTSVPPLSPSTKADILHSASTTTTNASTASHSPTKTDTHPDTSGVPEVQEEVKREMEGLARSEVARRG
ncbi:hypothetical protein B0H67DRAFT_565281 [Lasiosphaeris hirsuta]|uniref:Uncharacterized protein n=1 Tax=Lasiosphaeris hirsuta TaxID=260670 RepID=A0AA40BCE2_9PEZI|nr:hypothetical protein B0H67DRAFT_565281 [Lasiosphaeris hirsuta]